MDPLASLLQSPGLPGDLADHSAADALPFPNGANAPADNPEDADTLPARALRPDLRRCPGEPAPGDTDA